MKKYPVVLADSARQDLFEIQNWILANNGPNQAAHVIDSILNVLKSLETYPHRGVWLPELEPLGIFDFREVFLKPYRIIYRVDETQVSVMLIADGRRNMSQLLLQRLLK